jgi:CIC family chloride channel protein
MIFEMTHQFGMVPALMLGTLVSQSIARLAGRHNFYTELLEQDGVAIHKISPPRDLAAWRTLPVSAFANRKPVAVTDLAPAHLRMFLKQHPFRCFPVMLEGVIKGVVTRGALEHAAAHGAAPAWEDAIIVQADRRLEEIEPLLIKSNAGLLLVTETEGGPVTGVFTLHDLLRAQAAVQE